MRRTVAFVVFVLGGACGVLWAQSVEEAKQSFDAGDYATAALAFEEAFQKSRRCEYAFYAGMSRYRLREIGRALLAFQESIQCDPKSPLPHLAKAEAYAEMGNVAEALVSYGQVLTLDPLNTTALRGSATLYLRNNFNREAAKVLEILVGQEPENPQAHADWAVALLASGHLDRAEQEFRTALKLKADFAPALLGLGNVHLSRGAEEEAIQTLRRAAELVPNGFEPRYLLGTAYNRLGRHAEAVRELEAALGLGGNETEVYYHLARAYGGLGKPEERRKALDQFAALSKVVKADEQAKLRSTKLAADAKLLVGKGDLAGALDKMEEARRLEPGNPTILFGLASLNYDGRRYASAREFAQTAIALVPSEWLYHFLLGLIEGRSGRLSESLQSLRVAERLNSSAADVQNAIGEVLLRSGEIRAAISKFERATELDPSEAAYRLNLESARQQISKSADK